MSDIKQLYRLRVPAVTMAWMHEVATSPGDAINNIEREFENKYVFSDDHREWEVEFLLHVNNPLTMDEIEFMCKEIRRLRREVNKLTKEKGEALEEALILREGLRSARRNKHYGGEEGEYE